MIVHINDLRELGALPRHGTSVSEWLKRKSVPITAIIEKGGRVDSVLLSDLPTDIQQAYMEHLAEDTALDIGEVDDAAYEALFERPLKAQHRAQENAAKLLFIVMTWHQIEKAGKKAFGIFTTRNTRNEWKTKTKDVAPANWAPALAPDWTDSEAADKISPEAMDLLKLKMLLGGKNGTG